MPGPGPSNVAAPLRALRASARHPSPARGAGRARPAGPAGAAVTAWLAGLACGFAGAAWLVYAAGASLGRGVPPAALLSPDDPALAVLHTLRLVSALLAGLGAAAAAGASISWASARSA